MKRIIPEMTELAWQTRQWEEAADKAIDALLQCWDYMDERADADCDQDGFIPNEEMRLKNIIDEGLKALGHDS